jgi:hypothetical protein
MVHSVTSIGICPCKAPSHFFPTFRRRKYFGILPQVPDFLEFGPFVVRQRFEHHWHPVFDIVFDRWDEFSLDIFQNGINDINERKFSVTVDTRRY